MAEIETPLVELREGSTHDIGPDEYLITEEHTTRDVIRWLITQVGKEEVEYETKELCYND